MLNTTEEGDSGNDHSHYGLGVQAALSHFRSCYAAHNRAMHYDFKDQGERHEALQEAFSNLCRMRRRETGFGFYLNKEKYTQAVEAKNGNAR